MNSNIRHVRPGPSFGAQVKKKRDELSYTQAGLAKALGVSQATISAWEQDGKTPAPENQKETLDRIDELILLAGRRKLAGGTDEVDGPLLVHGEPRIIEDGRKIFGDVRDYIATLSGRPFHVWLLGPATLPIAQMAPLQAQGSLELWVENITQYGARYHIIWDLDRMVNSGLNALKRGISGHELFLAFQRVENALKHASSDKRNVESIIHIPIASRGNTDARDYWNSFTKEMSDQNWDSHVCYPLPDDLPELRKEIDLSTQILISLWSYNTSVVLYSPKKDANDFFAPDPIANTRLVDLQTHWDRSQGEQVSPYFWLPTEEVKVIEHHCKALFDICKRVSDDRNPKSART